jgi:predicted nucleic acid-binding protein
MISPELYVVDTTAIISFFYDVFQQRSAISSAALKIMEAGFSGASNVRLSIPSIVFVELFEKWHLKAETAAQIRYEIVNKVIFAEHVEIRSLDPEVLENFIGIDDEVENLENHDKIVLASAMTLECPLITSDHKILSYVNKHRVIPRIIQ